MRKRNVCTLEGSNGYRGKEYLPLWNERFTVRPASASFRAQRAGKARPWLPHQASNWRQSER
jgi:hypothetical protein